MADSDIIFQVDDSKSRPLITVRNNGLASFYRYAEMEKEDRHVILKYFSSLKQRGYLSEGFENKTEQDIEDYLDFKTDEDFCG